MTASIAFQSSSLTSLDGAIARTKARIAAHQTFVARALGTRFHRPEVDLLLALHDSLFELIEARRLLAAVLASARPAAAAAS